MKTQSSPLAEKKEENKDNFESLKEKKEAVNENKDEIKIEVIQKAELKPKNEDKREAKKEYKKDEAKANKLEIKSEGNKEEISPETIKKNKKPNEEISVKPDVGQSTLDFISPNLKKAIGNFSKNWSKIAIENEEQYLKF